MRVEFFRHNISSQDIARASRVLHSLFLTTGDSVDEFERNFARFFGQKCFSVGMQSCTGALQLCLTLFEVGNGDEVITTPLSYVATANAIIQAGARPVFVDVDPETGNLDLKKVESAVTPRTKAIIPVHLYGQMVQMRELNRIAKKHKLAVIEDAAHAIEATDGNIRPGTLSDAACFSFYATKSITCGEGGAVIVRNKRHADILKSLRLHGVTKTAVERYRRNQFHYDMDRFGWKYNMDNIQAALLIGQLEHLSKNRDARAKIADKYEAAFRGDKNISFLKTRPGVVHARHLFTIHVEPKIRDAALMALKKRGVGVTVNYHTPIHLLSWYRETFDYKPGGFPVAESIASSTISLPLYPKLKQSEVEYVIKTTRDVVSKLSRR